MRGLFRQIEEGKEAYNNDDEKGYKKGAKSVEESTNSSPRI